MTVSGAVMSTQATQAIDFFLNVKIHDRCIMSSSFFSRLVLGIDLHLRKERHITLYVSVKVIFFNAD